LSAPTSGIAKEAGVANGSLFTYFETKAELFNQLYLELKQEMAVGAMQDFPEGNDLREQLFHVWRLWMAWAVMYPEKRRVLAQLSVWEELWPKTRMAGHKTMAGIGALVDRCQATGTMRDAPKGFVQALMNSVAETTMDFMMQDPERGDEHCTEGFDALWRMIA